MTSLGIRKGGQHTRTVEGVQELTCGCSCWGHAELVIQPLGQAQPLSVPRISLSEPPSRALHPKMLLGAIDHPFELIDDLLDRWLTLASTEQLLEDPGVSKRAARQQNSGHARVFVGLARLFGV